MTEIKGLCNDCLFFIQEWHLDWVHDKDDNIQMFMELDKYCRLCQIFKSPNGYCDCWEKE